MELDVVFRNKEGQKLIGTVAYPQGYEQSPGIVLCHGFTGNKDGHFYPAMSKALVAEGFAVLRFDCRHCGKSEGDFHATYKTMPDDIVAAIEYFRKQDRVESVSLVGHSMGGTSVILVAAQDHDVQSIVAISGVAHPASIKKRQDFTKQPDGTYTLTKRDKIYLFEESFFTDAEECKPLAVIKEVRAPLHIIHGTADEKVDIS